jgi:cyclophilin family peptidyl-prolyl cis-trans isomerase
MLISMVAFLTLSQAKPAVPVYKPNGPKIEFVMASGKSFVITTDPKASPKTVAHILDLVKKGFYDRQRVHRVEYWVTQWGAPASRDKPLDSDAVGDGGSGHDVPFEMSDVDFTRGVVGVASNGLQMGGDSQLFILKRDWMRLYHSYAVVGKVTKGMEVVDAIKRGDRIRKAVVKK